MSVEQCDIDCCVSILRVMLEDAKNKKLIDPDNITKCIGFLIDRSRGPITDLKDHGFRSVHKQGFIV